jgi:hypothetical protein
MVERRGDATPSMTRRNIHVPDPVWERAEAAARRQSEEERRSVSIAEWVRVAIVERLARQ